MSTRPRDTCDFVSQTMVQSASEADSQMSALRTNDPNTTVARHGRRVPFMHFGASIRNASVIDIRCMFAGVVNTENTTKAAGC